jgi:predicted acyltransferase
MNKRIEAIDVLRGITLALMVLVNSPGSWSVRYPMLRHATWNGFTPTDFVFPCFLFLMGVSMFFSLRKSDFTLSWKVGKRFLLLVGIGLLLNVTGMLVNGRWDPANLRIMGVLQRFGLCFGITAVLVCKVPHRWLGWVAAGILVFYSALLLLGNGYAEDPGSIIARVDNAILGESHLYRWGNGIDPEGLLSTIPAVAHTLIGFLIGKVLAQKDFRRMDSAGTLLLVGGFLLMWLLPLNKKIWSPSFVLVVCGLGTLLLSLLYWLIDETHRWKYTGFFKVFGTNAIYCYLMSDVMAWTWHLTGFQTWAMSQVPETEFTSLLFALFCVGLIYLTALPLYKKKIFLKL